MGLPDWPMHIAEYAGLGALTARALAGAGRSGSGRRGRRSGRLRAVRSARRVAPELRAGTPRVRGGSPGRHHGSGDGAARGGACGQRRQRRRDRGGIEIKLFGRRDCHLCDEAEKTLNEACTRTASRSRNPRDEDRRGYRRVARQGLRGSGARGDDQRRRLFKYRVDRNDWLACWHRWTGRRGDDDRKVDRRDSGRRDRNRRHARGGQGSQTLDDVLSIRFAITEYDYGAEKYLKTGISMPPAVLTICAVMTPFSWALSATLVCPT